jgi:O-acetyl-ADP-ribose deacetylase (regulator of RNase III)
MFQRPLRGVTIECVRGNIAHQPDMDAVVNAANAQLRSGGGVAGAIHAAAGPGLESECRAFAPIRPGQAVITGAHGLPNRFVIHCLGPVYGRDEPADELLASCYRNALRLAAQDNVGSVAFPAISTGSFGYPLEAAAEIAVATVVASVREAQAPVVNLIRFVLFDAAAERIFAQLIGRLVPPTQADDR